MRSCSQPYATCCSAAATAAASRSLRPWRLPTKLCRRSASCLRPHHAGRSASAVHASGRESAMNPLCSRTAASTLSPISGPVKSPPWPDPWGMGPGGPLRTIPITLIPHSGGGDVCAGVRGRAKLNNWAQLLASVRKHAVLTKESQKREKWMPSIVHASKCPESRARRDFLGGREHRNPARPSRVQQSGMRGRCKQPTTTRKLMKG